MPLTLPGSPKRTQNRVPRMRFPLSPVMPPIPLCRDRMIECEQPLVKRQEHLTKTCVQFRRHGPLQSFIYGQLNVFKFRPFTVHAQKTADIREELARPGGNIVEKQHL